MNNNIVKKLSDLKSLLLALVLVVFLKLPMNAQYNDLFFINDEVYDNRGEEDGEFNIGTQIFGSDVNGGYNITTQVFGQNTPLGGGLLIMIGTGALYAAMKHKRTSRH